MFSYERRSAINWRITNFHAKKLQRAPWFFLNCNAVYFEESATFRRNIFPPFSSWVHLLSCFCWFNAWFTLQPWRWRWYITPKRRAISVLCVTDVRVVRASNATMFSHQHLEHCARQKFANDLVIYSSCRLV